MAAMVDVVLWWVANVAMLRLIAMVAMILLAKGMEVLNLEVCSPTCWLETFVFHELGNVAALIKIFGETAT